MRLWLALSILLAGLAASEPADAKRKGDQERARAAVRAGELLPLPTILRQVRRATHGRVLDADIEETGRGQWLYFIKVLTPEGNVQHLVIDGHSGQILDIRGQGD